MYFSRGGRKQGLTTPPPEMYPSPHRIGDVAGFKQECPIGQGRQDDASSPLWVPPAQTEHDVSPIWLKVPLVQGSGSADLSSHDFPAGQEVHTVEPMVSEYVPSAHVVQLVAPPGEAVPAGHSVGTLSMVLHGVGYVWTKGRPYDGSGARGGGRGARTGSTKLVTRRVELPNYVAFIQDAISEVPFLRTKHEILLIKTYRDNVPWKIET